MASRFLHPNQQTSMDNFLCHEVAIGIKGDCITGVIGIDQN
jgi:hypothetical protein